MALHDTETFMSLVKRCTALLIAALAFGAEAQLAASEVARPDVLMRTATAEVIAILEGDAAAGRPTDVARLIETKVLPLFDFERMTRLAMARHWRLATPAQQGELVAQFTALLVRTYSTALSGYRDEEIHYRPLREVVVRASVRRGGMAPMTIDYEMQETPAGWKVHDVTVAGMSLVITHRASFAAVVRSRGIDGLIEALAGKNRASAPRLTPPGRS